MINEPITEECEQYLTLKNQIQNIKYRNDPSDYYIYKCLDYFTKSKQQDIKCEVYCELLINDIKHIIKYLKEKNTINFIYNFNIKQINSKLIEKYQIKK